MFKLLIGFLAAITVAAGSLGAEPEPLEFKGVKLGMTEQELQKIVEVECSNAKPTADRLCIKHLDSIAKVPATISYSLFSDKVLHIYIRTGNPQKNFSYIKDALVAKYGPPTKFFASELTNRMGAKFLDETLLWKRSYGNIEARKYAGSIENSMVTFASPLFEEAAARRRGESAKIGAKDL